MTRFIPLTVAAPLALAALSLPMLTLPASAQQMVQSLASTDADLLAAQMRQLAANPRDVNALATAGELSLKLGDLSAAASLFARADKVDSGNGRVKAGMAAILVRSERPGEALRFYEQAERSGLPTTRYAADRGLAYDLIGEQERAQRDYRAALAVSRDDETVRRYALSLGISGRQAQALAQLDPLIRRQDRAGWRAQAFVLAMNGDTAAATKIVTAMMPGNLAQGLAAFFQRLPSLSPVDRAFAVHFGEIQPTPERIADARLAPKLAPLAGEMPVQVAAVAPTPIARATGRDNRRGRTVTPVGRVPTPVVAQVAATPVAAPPVASSSPPIVWAAPRAVVQPLPTEPAVVARPSPPVEVAASPVAPVQSSAATQRADSVLARIVANLSIPAEELGVGVAARPATPTPRPSMPVKVAAAPASAAGRRVVAEASAKEARDTAVRRVVAARMTGNAAADDAAPDSRVVPLTRAQQRAADRKALAATVDAKGRPLTPAQRRAAARKAAAEEATTVAAVEDEKPLTPAQKRAAARKAAAVAAAEEKALTPAEKRAAARKEAAETKKTADRKALAAKAAADKKAARSNPARIWVQVASGANDAYLGQAWKTITAKAPQAFRGKAGYSQSVRATNRVMTGPFKTDAEARAFVNQLAKQGVPAYSVTTDAGEPVAKLPAK